MGRNSADCHHGFLRQLALFDPRGQPPVVTMTIAARAGKGPKSHGQDSSRGGDLSTLTDKLQRLSRRARKASIERRAQTNACWLSDVSLML